MKNVKMIVAMDRKNGIGFQNELPWPKNSADLEWFRNSTTPGVVLMGGNTALSLKRALRDRTNIVYTDREAGLPKEFGKIWGEPEECLEHLSSVYADQTIWIIGGAKTYEIFAEYADELYLTIFPTIFECDTFLSKSVLEQFAYKKEHHQYENLDFVILTKDEEHSDDE